jgi:hypothetical protein
MIELRERIDVRELTFTDPKTEGDLPSSLERYISHENWSRLEEPLEREFVFLNGTGSFAQESFINSMCFIAPERVRAYVTENEWEKMNRKLDNSNSVDKLQLIASMTLLDPKKEYEKHLLSASDVMNIANRFVDSQQQKHMRAIGISNLALMQIFDPVNAGNLELELIDSYWDEEKDAIRIVLDDEKEDKIDWSFVTYLSDIKLALPQKFNELSFSEKDWGKVWGFILPNLDTDDINLIPRRVSVAVILAAKEIKMTPEGFKITMPDEKETFIEQQNPIPKLRRF